MSYRTGTDTFYAALPPFRRFADIADMAAYAPVPDDWSILITDVRGSTAAIEAGRYKNVNMVGAASITAVLNISGTVEIPFVFGGDGATLVVPSGLVGAATRALLDLQAASESLFGLTLRVGAIPVADLRRRGTDIRLRKYELSPGNHLAMISGGGAELADALLKQPDPDNPYVLEADTSAAAPDLTGLSCRWEPLVPQNGHMMTLMVLPIAQDVRVESIVLGEILDGLAEILGHGLEDSAPASRFSMRFRWPPRDLGLEARATRGTRPAWRHMAGLLLESFLQSLCERFDWRMGSYNAPVYRSELRSNTDFRKFDGLFRSVLDVSKAEADAIEAYLEAGYAERRLVYGVHRADRALMTCLVFNLDRGEHVHFIDGANGGFALAATGFKRRKAQLDG
ncbi:MAG: DUF3095 domain-containing protein [Pseudomonadota bacterium]